MGQVAAGEEESANRPGCLPVGFGDERGVWGVALMWRR